VLMTRAPVAQRLGTLVDKLRVQLFLGLGGGVLLPSLLLIPYWGEETRAGRGVTFSLLAGTLAIIAATLIVRRVAEFPWTRFTYILPSYASCYGLALATLFLTRSEYNRLFLSVSFAVSLLIAMAIALQIARTERPVLAGAIRANRARARSIGDRVDHHEVKGTLSQEFFELLVHDRRLARVQHLDPLSRQVDGYDLVVLGQQDGVGQPDITQAKDCDLHTKTPCNAQSSRRG
jgi:hypothetical protein